MPKDLSDADLAACVDVIVEGDAVDPDSAAVELPHALCVVVARIGTTVVGITVIKRARPVYAAGVAKKSGVVFPANAPELGYVAIRKAYEGHGLGGVLVSQALASYGNKPLFATTSHPAMKKHLARAGFGRFGKGWPGKHGELTLWLLR